MKETVLVVAAHPDDEVLGCGGTIARHAKSGDSVNVLFIADGEGSRGSLEGVGSRMRSAIEAARVLGANEPVFLNLPDNRLDSLDLLDIIKHIEIYIQEISPTIVYTHHPSDLNIDHNITCKAVMTACRPLPEHSISSIYAFEVPSSTEWAMPIASTTFLPTRWVDISTYLDQRQAALQCYRSEIRPFPHPRSQEAIISLARWRGAASGLQAAEAFVVLREIIR